MTDRLIVDLHSHSTASDGTLSPSELAKKAHDDGICAVALTDHDTVDGLKEFMSACKDWGVEGISGVEISAQHDKTLHIVGLYIDENDTAIAQKLKTLRDGREVRNRRMLELLSENGFDITEEDILSQKDGALLGNTGRAHIARAMVQKGYVSDTNEAFSKYLKRGNSCYVKRITYSAKESIEMIKNAGGMAILAHPILITEDYDELFAFAKELKNAGLDGMECYYNNYTEKFSKMCQDICRRLDMAESGGSDFHGENKPDVHLGRVSTGTVPYSVLRRIKERRGK